jgi:hypothetical protein
MSAVMKTSLRALMSTSGAAAVFLLSALRPQHPVGARVAADVDDEKAGTAGPAAGHIQLTQSEGAWR